MACNPVFSSNKKPITSRFLTVFFAGLACLSSGVSALAATQPQAATDRLTLRTAITESLSSHPELAAYGHRLKAAEGAVTQAGVGVLPRLGVDVENALGSGDYNGTDSAETTVSISWVLQDTLLEKRVQQAQRQISALQIEERIATLDIAAQTARYYLELLLLQERETLALEAQQQARKALGEIRKRVTVGRLPLADQLRAEVELAKRDLVLEDLDHEQITARQRLAAQWAAPAASFAHVAGDIQLPDSPVDYATLKTRIENTPDIQWFFTRERIAQSAIDVALAESQSGWQFNVGIRRTEANDDVGFVAGFSVPLGQHNSNRGRIAELSAHQNRYRSEAQALRIERETRLFDLVQSVLHSRHVMSALQQKIIPKLRKALLETQQAYELGRYSYQEWFAVQQALLDARFNLLDVQFDAHLKRVEIERLTGLSLSEIASDTALKRSLVSQ